MMSDNTDTDLHNEGQADGSEGKYEPPHGIIDELTTWSSEGMQNIREENEAYDKGWDNGYEQRK